MAGLKKAGAGFARLGPALQGTLVQFFHSDTGWESCRMWKELEKELEGQPGPLVRILLRDVLYIEVRAGMQVGCSSDLGICRNSSRGRGMKE